MKYENVIFDLDGTLLDTLADIADSVNHTMTAFGLPELNESEVRAHVGNGSARLIELCLPGGRENPEFGAALAHYSAWYEDHCRIKTRPYPGITELLRRLNAAGVRCAVVSNKPDAAVQELDRLFFRGLTRAAVGERPGIRRKPAPDSLLAVMESLGASPAETVYVGDSEVDIITAGNAGVDCVSVLWGFRDRGELEERGASVLVSDAEELWSALSGENNE